MLGFCVYRWKQKIFKKYTKLQGKIKYLTQTINDDKAGEYEKKIS